MNSQTSHFLVSYKNAQLQPVKKKSRSTPFPSGKQRQKKSGRGLPTPSLMASVITEVISTENRRPKDQKNTKLVNANKTSESFIQFQKGGEKGCIPRVA